ncbi:winged helix-turn-helix transcriptional regulator [Escherichia coli]|nr:winged helix-turn-helix transcriptional regulator [Escherichia coli]
MTITIRGQILAALRNNPGLNSARIASMIGMTTKKISGTVSTLLADGLIEFEGKHGQRLYRLTDYGMKYEIPESEDIEWQQDMLREIDSALDVLRDEHEHAEVVEEIINDITARIASLRAYSGY